MRIFLLSRNTFFEVKVWGLLRWILTQRPQAVTYQWPVLQQHGAKRPAPPRDAVVAAELPGCSSALGLPLPILDQFSVKPDCEKSWRRQVCSGTWQSLRILLPDAKRWSFGSSSSLSYCPIPWADSCFVLDESEGWSCLAPDFCKRGDFLTPLLAPLEVHE